MKYLKQINYITQDKNIKKAIPRIEQARVLGVDTETGGLNPRDGIRLLQLATQEDCFLFDLKFLSSKKINDLILPLLMDEWRIKVFQNAAFDLKFLKHWFDVEPDMPSVFDTMFASQLLSGGNPKMSNSLDAVAQRFLNLYVDKNLQTSNWMRDNLYEEQLIYAGLDAAVLVPLYSILSKNLNDNQLQRAFILEMECLPATVEMEMTGMKLDVKTWKQLIKTKTAEKKILEASLKSMLGDININSNPQVREAIRNNCWVEVDSLDAKSRAKIIFEYKPEKNMFEELPPQDIREVVKLYGEYVKLGKWLSAFGQTLIDQINPDNGRIQSSLRQIGTDTARYTNSKPNLQQIPSEEEYRKCFIPEKGNKLVCGDYSQIELRIIGEFARERNFLEAFMNNIDLHRQTPSKIFNVPVEKIGKDHPLRALGKILNFGSAYGMGADSYSEKTGKNKTESEKDLRAFYRAHPDFENWLGYQVGYFKRFNLVRSASGRYRDLSFWKANNQTEYLAKQASRNFPIQATSADITKKALGMLYRVFKDREIAFKTKPKICHAVHDEIIVECAEEDANIVALIVEETMLKAARVFLKIVPVKVDVKISDYWSH